MEVRGHLAWKKIIHIGGSDFTNIFLLVRKPAVQFYARKEIRKREFTLEFHHRRDP